MSVYAGILLVYEEEVDIEFDMWAHEELPHIMTIIIESNNIAFTLILLL